MRRNNTKAMCQKNASEQHNNYMSKKSVGTTQKLCVKKNINITASLYVCYVLYPHNSASTLRGRLWTTGPMAIQRRNNTKAMCQKNASEQHNNYMSKKSVGTTQKLCAKKKHQYNGITLCVLCLLVRLRNNTKAMCQKKSIASQYPDFLFR
jgi:hypothetical protein